MTIFTRAPGKMILIGEYAVLEGAPSLVRAVDRYAEVQIFENPVGNFSVEAPNLGVPFQDFIITKKGNIRFDPNGIHLFLNRLSFFSLLFETIWRFYNDKNIEIKYCKIILDTTSFYDSGLKNKLGMGSSAALTVALVKAVEKWVYSNSNYALKDDDIFLLALKAHRQAQNGVGSGIDIASSVYGGIIEYTIVKDDEKNFNLPKIVFYPDNLSIISVWTGKSASTRKMVGSVNEFKKNSYLRYTEIMDNLVRISKQSCADFKKGEISGFLSKCSLFYEQLIRLGEESGAPIISEVHQEIEKIVRQNGGVYKPSGAGSGDLGIAMTDNPDDVSVIISAIEKSGFKTVNLNTSSTGVQLINTN
ncbi:hypothetical protein KAH27_10950 [bacterium]|nr:hypothetical protein [bacterium]